MMRSSVLVVLLLASSSAFAQSPPPLTDGSAPADVSLTPQAAIDASVGNPQLERQIGGDYGKLDRPVLEPLGIIQRSWDKAPPDAGHYRVPYGSPITPKLRARVGMPLTIVLPEGERPVKNGVVIGSRLVQLHPSSAFNRVVLEAYAPGADTGMTILGASGRTYPFYVRTESHTSKAVPDLLVTFDGPPVTPLHPLDIPAETTADGVPNPASPTAALKLNFRWSMSGDQSIAPDTVFSDDRFTYLRWSPDRWHNSDLPSVYRVVDGVDEPIPPPQVFESTLVVKEVGPLTLRSGTRFVCVRPTFSVPAALPAPIPVAP